MDSTRYKTTTSTATSTSGMVFGWVCAICACALLVMGTIKAGMLMFG